MTIDSDACRSEFTPGQFDRMDMVTAEFKPMLAEGLSPPVIIDNQDGPVVWNSATFQDRDIYVLAGASLTIPAGEDVELRGVDLYVAPEATLTVNGTLRMNEDAGDPVIARIRGTLDGSGDILCDEGSEIIALDGGVIDETGGLSIDMSCAEACLMAREGGTIHFGTGTHTFSGGAFLVNNGGTMIFEDGAEVVLEDLASETFDRFEATAGSVFRFGDGASLTVKSRTLINGTATEPVVFEGDGLSAGQRWDGLRIEGDDAEISYAEFSSATEALDVRATGVTLDHVTLSGNTTGLRTDYACPVGCLAPERAEVAITNSKISENSVRGVYARNADLSLQATSVEYNTDYGIYATNATLDPVRDVRLTDTGYDPADGTPIPLALGRGVYLSASGELHLGGPLMDAPNRIAGNAGGEIVAAAGSYLFVGDPFSGTNAIFDATGGYLIANYGSSVIMTEKVYWGDVNGPPAGAFYDKRYIDADPFETTDPSDGAGAPFRQAPGKGTVLAASTQSEAYTPGEAAAGRGGDAWVVWLRGQLRQLRQDLRDNPGDDQALGRLRRLVYLQRLDRDDAAGERVATRAVLRLIRQHLGEGGSLPPRFRRVAERALRAEVESALATEEYVWADSLYGAYAAHVATPRERFALLLAGASLDERRGDYTGAIAKVSEVIAVAEGADTEEVAMLVEALQGELATLQVLMEEADSRARGTATTAAKADTTSRAGSGLPTEFVLEAAYPNPFSGATMLPLALPERAEVRVVVYDVLGREVAVVADGQLEAGRHAFSLDGSQLAGGVYIVRATAGVHIATRHVTLVR